MITTPIVNQLQALLTLNHTLPLCQTKRILAEIENDARALGFDPEWLAMVFCCCNVKDWVRMAVKLEHLRRLFMGRVVCVERFIVT